MPPFVDHVRRVWYDAQVHEPQLLQAALQKLREIVAEFAKAYKEEFQELISRPQVDHAMLLLSSANILLTALLPSLAVAASASDIVWRALFALREILRLVQEAFEVPDELLHVLEASARLETTTEQSSDSPDAGHSETIGFTCRLVDSFPEKKQQVEIRKRRQKWIRVPSESVPASQRLRDLKSREVPRFRV